MKKVVYLLLVGIIFQQLVFAQGKVTFKPEKPKAGDDVEFHLENDSVYKASLIGDYVKGMQPVKSRKIAGILGLLLGAIGLHRIYLGFYWTALMQIVVTVLSGGFGVLWGFIEGVLILGAYFDKDAKGRRLK